jgi:hypothetical protein
VAICDLLLLWLLLLLLLPAPAAGAAALALRDVCSSSVSRSRSTSRRLSSSRHISCEKIFYFFIFFIFRTDFVFSFFSLERAYRAQQQAVRAVTHARTRPPDYFFFQREVSCPILARFAARCNALQMHEALSY